MIDFYKITIKAKVFFEGLEVRYFGFCDKEFDADKITQCIDKEIGSDNWDQADCFFNNEDYYISKLDEDQF